MKLKFTTLFIALMAFVAISTYGQDVSHPISTNNGFETWEDYGADPTLHRPVGWSGSDGLIQQFAPLAGLAEVTLTSQVQIEQGVAGSHEGNNFVKITSKNIGDPGVQPGVLANGYIDIDILAALALFPDHLDQILNAVNFSNGQAVTNRVARAYVWLKRGDTEGKDNYAVRAVAQLGTDIVGEGYVSVAPTSVEDWTRIKVDVTYTDPSVTPDSLYLIVMSSDVNSPEGASDGNSVLVDGEAVFQYEGEEPLPIDDLHQTATLNNTDATITWNASIKDNVDSYTVQHSLNAKDWDDASEAFGQLADKQYSYTQYGLDNGNHFYRLKVQMLTGETEYTDVMRVDVKGNADIMVWPNPVTNGQVHLSGIPQGAGLAVYSATGQEVLRINNAQSREDLNLSSFANGVYIIKVVDGSGQSLFSKQIVK